MRAMFTLTHRTGSVRTHVTTSMIAPTTRGFLRNTRRASVGCGPRLTGVVDRAVVRSALVRAVNAAVIAPGASR